MILQNSPNGTSTRSIPTIASSHAVKRVKIETILGTMIIKTIKMLPEIQWTSPLEHSS